jgi:membrane protease YdiL (CAAX protease family)
MVSELESHERARKPNGRSSVSGIIRGWNRIPILVRSLTLGIVVSLLGVYASLIAAALVPPPWSLLAFLGVSWILYKYFSGSWWPGETSKARSHSIRTVRMPARLWKISLLASFLLVVLVQSGFVFTFRIIEYPADMMTSEYNFDEMPTWEAWLFILVSAMAAGVFEEMGFRGYAQVPLEERYGPVAGITLVSILFLLSHLTQGWIAPLIFHVFAGSVLYGILAFSSGSLVPGMIAHTIIDVFMFSYWWSDVAGTFNRQPVGVAGIDLHFILWTTIFVASSVLFFLAVRETNEVRRMIDYIGHAENCENMGFISASTSHIDQDAFVKALLGIYPSNVVYPRFVSEAFFRWSDEIAACGKKSSTVIL